MSSWTSCSRLSTFFTWGHISLRTVFQALTSRQQVLRIAAKGGGKQQVGEAPGSSGAGDGAGSGWLKSLAAFAGRLRWRSHFMQKLEMEPELETRCQCQAFEGDADPEAALRLTRTHSQGGRRGEAMQCWLIYALAAPRANLCDRQVCGLGQESMTQRLRRRSRRGGQACRWWTRACAVFLQLAG